MLDDSDKQTTVIRHGCHYQAGYLCCLALACFSNLYHSFFFLALALSFMISPQRVVGVGLLKSCLIALDEHSLQHFTGGLHNGDGAACGSNEPCFLGIFHHILSKVLIKCTTTPQTSKYSGVSILNTGYSSLAGRSSI